LCLATGSLLHLVGQPGFRLDERALRRASADHWREVEWLAHPTLAEFEAQHAPERIFCLSKHGTTPYTRIAYQPGDAFLFGRESAGLPPEVLARYRERTLCIPMPAGRVRSLNLANAVAIVLYEALRQVYGW
jgi:tRNA (cytidine/uridine-2'-O-)-methyltransferase